MTGEITKVEYFDDRWYKITYDDVFELEKIEYFPSMTTVLGIKSEPFLARWRVDICGNAEADFRNKLAKQKGTRIHAAIAKLLLGCEVMIEDFEQEEWVQLLRLPNTGTMSSNLPKSSLSIPPTQLRTNWQFHYLEAFANQTAMAIERAFLAEEAQQALLKAEKESLRNTLLSSISHDLRTPLSAIQHRRREHAVAGRRDDRRGQPHRAPPDHS